MKIHSKNHYRLASILLIAGCLSACRGTPGKLNPDAGPDIDPEPTLFDTLQRLGVNTAETPRLDNRGDPYPDSYSPLGAVVASRVIADSNIAAGSRMVMGRAEELLLVGVRPDGQGGVVTVMDDLSSGTETSGFTVSDILYETTEAEAPWAVDRNPQGNSASGPAFVQGSLRDGTAADLNGNGFRESAIVYYVEYVDGTSEIRLHVSDGMAPTPAVSDVSIAIDTTSFPVNDLRVTSGDFDGDGTDEIALAVSQVRDDAVANTPVRVFIIDDEAAGFAVTNELQVPLTTTLTAPHITLDVESAQLDHGAAPELVLLVNENLPSPSPGTFASQYFVFEVTSDALTEISSGPIVAEQDGIDHVAVVADLTVGDLDGDRVDELVFSGLEEVISNCSAQELGEPLDGLKHVLVALGNKFNDFATVKSSAYVMGYAACPATGFTMRYTHANILDFDGDGDADIQVNDRVFDDFPSGVSVAMGTIPNSALLFGDTWLDRANSTIVVSDQSGDGIDDIVSVLLVPDDPYYNVWTCDPVIDGGGQRVENRCNIVPSTRVALNPNDMSTASVNPGTTHVNPILIPVDVDNDDVILMKFENEHILDFTEPMVLAALAAPPCERGIGQNTDACTTTWGASSSAAVGTSYKVTVSASAGLGIGGAGGGVDIEILAILSVAASRETSQSYELSRSRSFTTGPLEDSVVFTCLPLDRYTYRYIASFDKELLGKEFVVNLPRETVTLIAGVDYYNANIQSDALHIDSRVFAHTTGRVDSYPVELGKDAILAAEKSKLQDAREALIGLSKFDPIEALGGLETSVVSVGIGGGSTSLGLDYAEVEGQANAMELGFENDIHVAAGVAFSMSFGISGERTMSISHGDSTIYSGSIGSIESDTFPDNQYEFGLFTYLQALEGREFEVINYWVNTYD